MTGEIQDLFAFALNLYRAPLQYRSFIGGERPVPDNFRQLLETLNKRPEHPLWGELAAALSTPADELREAGFFLLRRVLFVEGADHYRVLGLPPDAGLDAIRERYRLLIGLFHPDKNPQGDEWGELYAPKINDAYNILKNPEKKRRYDLQRPTDPAARPSTREAASAAWGDVGRPPGTDHGGSPAANRADSTESPFDRAFGAGSLGRKRAREVGQPSAEAENPFDQDVADNREPVTAQRDPLGPNPFDADPDFMADDQDEYADEGRENAGSADAPAGEPDDGGLTPRWWWAAVPLLLAGILAAAWFGLRGEFHPDDAGPAVAAAPKKAEPQAAESQKFESPRDRSSPPSPPGPSSPAAAVMPPPLPPVESVTPSESIGGNLPVRVAQAPQGGEALAPLQAEPEETASPIPSPEQEVTTAAPGASTSPATGDTGATPAAEAGKPAPKRVAQRDADAGKRAEEPARGRPPTPSPASEKDTLPKLPAKTVAAVKKLETGSAVIAAPTPETKPKPDPKPELKPPSPIPTAAGPAEPRTAEPEATESPVGAMASTADAEPPEPALEPALEPGSPPLREGEPQPPKPSAAKIQRPDVDRLIARFIQNYELGDLDQFTALFSADVVTNDGIGKRAVSVSYGGLFANSSERTMEVIDLVWSGDQDGEATLNFEVRISVDRGLFSGTDHFAGNVDMRVSLERQRLLISRFIHQVDRL